MPEYEDEFDPLAQAVDEAGAGTIMGAIGFGGLFLVCGVLMGINLVSGEAEFVHGPRTSHLLVTILGENVFLTLSTLVCLLLGGVSLGFGVYAGYLSISINLLLNRAGKQEFEDKVTAAKKRGREARRKRRNEDEGAVELHCPHCKKVSRIPAAYAGRRGRCPKCKEEVRVPDE